MTIKFTYIAMLFAGITLIGCSTKQASEDFAGEAPVAVQVDRIALEGANRFLSVSGKVESVNSSNLSTRFMGHVDQILVGVGDTVKMGQQLLRISNAELSAKLAQVNAGIIEAKVAKENAEKDYNRYRQLFQDESVSQKEYDDITARYNMAKARFDAASEMKNEVLAQFRYTNITAPFAGVISSKFINEGDLANPGMPLLEIESPGDYQVIAKVPETEIANIRNGQKVMVSVNAVEKVIPGVVIELSTSSKNTGGQYVVKVDVEAESSVIKSGMFATVQFPMASNGTMGASVLVPRSALVRRGELQGVYTVSQSNTALLRWLRLGRVYGEQIEVLSGLEANEQYIIAAEGRLYNGASVTIQN